MKPMASENAKNCITRTLSLTQFRVRRGMNRKRKCDFSHVAGEVPLTRSEVRFRVGGWLVL